MHVFSVYPWGFQPLFHYTFYAHFNCPAQTHLQENKNQRMRRTELSFASFICWLSSFSSLGRVVVMETHRTWQCKIISRDISVTIALLSPNFCACWHQEWTKSTCSYMIFHCPHMHLSHTLNNPVTSKYICPYLSITIHLLQRKDHLHCKIVLFLSNFTIVSMALTSVLSIMTWWNQPWRSGSAGRNCRKSPKSRSAKPVASDLKPLPKVLQPRAEESVWKHTVCVLKTKQKRNKTHLQIFLKFCFRFVDMGTECRWIETTSVQGCNIKCDITEGQN